MSRIITGTINVQCDKYTTLENIKFLENDTLFKKLSLMGADMSEYGYSVVGTAEVTITLHDPDKIVGDKVEALRAEAMKVQADATAAVTRITRQINELLAITNEMSA